MKTIFGKQLDVTKLKSNVMDDRRKHLNEIISLGEELKNNHKPIIQRNCYVCDNENLIDFQLQVRGFRYLQCNNCTHVQTDKRYTDEAIKSFYTKSSYYSKTTYADLKSYEYRKNSVAKPKFEFAVQNFDGEKTWLDVGCGVGDLVSIAKENGFEVTGLELSNSSRLFAKQAFGVDLINEPLDVFAEKNDRTFGIISLIGLLEHVTNPKATLELCKRRLCPGGRIMIQVPNADSLATKTQKIWPSQIFRHMSPLEHIMVFTLESLKNLTNQCGLKIISIWYHGLDIYELINNISMEQPRFANSECYDLLLNLFNELQFIIDREKQSDRLLVLCEHQ